MKLTIDIPDDKAAQVVEAICSNYSYQEQVEVDGKMVDNPIAKPAFAKNKVIDFIKEHYKAYLIKQASETATKAVSADVTIS